MPNVNMTNLEIDYLLYMVFGDKEATVRFDDALTKARKENSKQDLYKFVTQSVMKKLQLGVGTVALKPSAQHIWDAVKDAAKQ